LYNICIDLSRVVFSSRQPQRSATPENGLPWKELFPSWAIPENTRYTVRPGPFVIAMRYQACISSLPQSGSDLSENQAWQGSGARIRCRLCSGFRQNGI
jgi:hypothetical protein